MKNNTCFAYGGANTYKGAKSKSLIELQQTGFNRFTVVYGLQVDAHLNYGNACEKLGAAIMHHQNCEGHIDSREKGEALKAGDTTPYFQPIEQGD